MTDALYATYGWCRLHDRPVVFELTLLGTDDPLTLASSTQRLAGLRRAIYRRCDGYVVMSPALEAACLTAGLSRDRVRLIPQGVDVRRFTPVADRSGLRRELGLPDDGPIVAFVGSLIERKGIDLMLEAWPAIHRACPTARLVLVGRDAFEGDPAATRFLDGRLADVPEVAARRVERLGLRDDVDRLLAAADVFAFPSRREGFGTVMIEAMACGVPPVVAELPGITDFVFGDDDDGAVIPQNHPGALAAAVTGLLRVPGPGAGGRPRGPGGGRRSVRHRRHRRTIRRLLRGAAVARRPPWVSCGWRCSCRASARIPWAGTSTSTLPDACDRRGCGSRS